MSVQFKNRESICHLITTYIEEANVVSLFWILKSFSQNIITIVSFKKNSKWK